MSGVAILVVILKGTGDVTDPPRPVAMTTSGQGCHIILCVVVVVVVGATRVMGIR